jgi:phosphatidylcholine synthase
MPSGPHPSEHPTPTVSQRIRGYSVHAYTASGVAVAFWIAAELVSPTPDARLVFALFAVAVLIDASDGPLARRWQVKRWAPRIDGRTIDDIVDYLTYTFLPLLLVWRMGWLPEPAAVWIVPALLASVLGFANTGAKDEGGGFFLGFPSYWNIVAFYLGLFHPLVGPWPNAAIVLGFTILTLAPVGFVYPNLAPRRVRWTLTVGALLWLALGLWMLLGYPTPPPWTILLSLIYPVLYMAASLALWSRRHDGSASGAAGGDR